MVRSSRPIVVLLAGLLLAACGGETETRRRSFQLAIESPPAGKTEVPFPVAVVRGVATEVETLSLRVSAGDETYDFEARPGITLAFATRGEAPAPLMALPGVPRERPPVEEQTRALKERLSDVAPEATLREPVGEAAFLVDLPAGRDGAIAAVVAAAGPAPQLLLLIEVLPDARYRTWLEGRTPPRLEAGSGPWNGTEEAFDAFKEAEVVRRQKALAVGAPYEPSRPDLLVVPRRGTGTQQPRDYAVVEWPANEAHRFGGHILIHATVVRDPNTGKPCVLYDVRAPYQEAFGDWTEANVGLPLAMVVNGEYRSAPVINGRLTDSVQITLGHGSWTELERQANDLAGALAGSVQPPPASLVAVSSWAPKGALEVLLPLEERVDTTLAIDAVGTSADRREQVARTFRCVPGTATDVGANVDARLAQMRLGSLTAQEAAPLLRADPAASIEALAAVAASDDASPRRCASAALLGLVDPESARAADALVGALDADDRELVRAAIRALHDPARHTRAAFGGLLRIAAGEDEELRHLASDLLDATDPPQRDWVLAAARDPEPGVRAAALSELGEQAGLGPLPLLLEGAKDADPRVRRAATVGLLRLSQRHAEGLGDHVPMLVALLQDEEEAVRINAAMVLGEIGERALPALLRAMEAGSEAAREASLTALLRVRELPPEAVEVFRRLLEDESLRIRLRAAAVLHRATGEVDPGVDAVQDFADADDETRTLVVQWLWWVAPEARRAEPWLRPLLDDDVDAIRVYAAAALERMGAGDERTRAILAAVASDPEHPLRGVESWAD